MITVEEAVAAICSGGVVIVPTDTVYGLACDPANPAAIEAVYELKDRPPHLELNLLAADVSQLDGLVEIGPTARTLVDAFWPGALALICPAGPRRLLIPRAGTSLMVRVPGHPLLRDLLRQSGPVASTSANRHGGPPPRTAEEALLMARPPCAGVVDGGPGSGMASTIIDLTSTPPRVLREGPVPATALRRHLGG
ncbi:MAG TPA: L-threonylcarbamoyladenylate synthase [Candidatus Binatia bacterium]|nr:L-threonylcarbamoyladenylate synthase [Candidatus Binatia bacterium]